MVEDEVSCICSHKAEDHEVHTYPSGVWFLPSGVTYPCTKCKCKDYSEEF